MVRDMNVRIEAFSAIGKEEMVLEYIYDANLSKKVLEETKFSAQLSGKHFLLWTVSAVGAFLHGREDEFYEESYSAPPFALDLKTGLLREQGPQMCQKRKSLAAYVGSLFEAFLSVWSTLPGPLCKIRVQMDAFLEDGSHEAILAVIRALVVALPHTTESLRDYLLSKLFHLSANQLPSSNMVRRRDRSNAFCEAIRALDATDLSAASVRDLLLPTIQNLLKDMDALDPAHKEALDEFI